jgi:curli biogenesis system outer membrane secretion channel CsgG
MRFILTPALRRQASHLATYVLLTMAASPAFSQSTVEICATKLGTLSVIEASAGYGYLSAYGLGSPAALLRLMIQQSDCFDVVERGAAFSSLQQERALAGGGELQQGSNLGKGQLQAADFVMTPNVQVSGNSGGLGGSVAGLGRLFGGLGATLGGLAGNVKFKEAQTSLLISDVRSGIQVAAAEGQASKTDFGIGGWGYGGGTFGGGGGYTNTPEGKMIAASLLDNYNNIVLQIRDKKQLIHQRSASSAANAANSIAATNVQPLALAPVHYTPQSQPQPQPQFQPVRRTSAAPQASIGYAGVFSGPDQGTFAVSITSDGSVTGSGNSVGYGRFFVQGSVDPSGNLSMSSSGMANGAQFSGVINQQSGQVNGVWMVSGANKQGSFTGGRM